MTKNSTFQLKLTNKHKVDLPSQNKKYLIAIGGMTVMGSLTCYIHSVVLFVILLVLAPSVKAQNVGFEWAKGMGGATSDQGNAIVADNNGNVYVTGYFSTRADFNPGDSSGVLTSAGSYDVFVSKYDPNGTFLWAKSMGGSGSDIGYGIAVDGSGNIYITGYFSTGADFNPGGRGGALTSAGGSDVFVAKYDPSGNFLWAKSMGGTGFDYGYKVAVDANDNVYVTGYFAMQGADFNPGGSGGALTSAGNTDVFLAKYSANGTFLWAKSMGGTGQDFGRSVAVDGNGNVYVTGYFPGAGADFNPGGIGGAVTSTGGNDVFLAKYDANGNFLWVKNMGGTGSDNGYGISVDNNNNVYVTGYFAAAGVDFNPGGNGGALTSAGGSDAFIAKYNPNGTFLWAKSMGGTGSDQGQAVAVDGNGNVYIAGYFNSPIADFNTGGSGGKVTSENSHDGYIAKYAANGSFLWVKSMGGTGLDYSYGVTVDGNNNVYVTGFFSSTGADFNRSGSGGVLASAGSDDIFVVKLRQGCEFSITLTESACDSFVFNGMTYTTSGTYVDTFTSSANCDSIVTLDLTILDTVWYSISDTVCDTYLLNGQTYTKSGSYTQFFTSALGCDSIVTLELIINLSTDSLFNGEFCDSVTFNGQTFTSSGTYVQEYKSDNGCDSNITYTLVINNSNGSTIKEVACDSFSIKDTTYFITDTYNILFMNEGGCDSTVVLELTINRSPIASIIKTGTTLTASSADSYQWINCDGNTVIAGATDQSFIVKQSGNYSVIVTSMECSDTAECVYVEVNVSINERTTGNQVKLYPNPTHGAVYIQTDKNLSNGSIRLVNMVGQVLKEYANQNGSVFAIDISGYAGGIYFLEINEGEKSVRLKVVKD